MQYGKGGGKAGYYNGGGKRHHGGGPGYTDGKHRLHRPWCLWAGPSSGEKVTTWSDRHQCVHEFNTAEDFWCMFHHALPPSRLDGAEFLLFKRDLAAPETKPCFRSGGRWTARVRAAKPNAWDDVWQSTVLALIGEDFAECGGEEVVSGAVISISGGVCRVELWLSEAADDEQVLAIGRQQCSMIWDTPGLWEKASQTLTYEDFTKRKVVVQLAGPKASKSTVGIFQ